MSSIFFEKCNNFEKALKALELGRLHHDFIEFFNRLSVEQKEQLQTNYEGGLKKMAVLLEQHDQFKDVAEILETLNIEVIRNILKSYEFLF